MIKENMNSLELYLDFPPEQIVEVKRIEDAGCGIYPCYYMKTNGKIKISTSARALIFDSGQFVRNRNFNPPDFLKPAISKKLLASALWRINKLGRFIHFGIFQPYKSWYESYETIDKRIRKLKPFEIVDRETRRIDFKPDYSLNNPEELIDKSIYYFKKFIDDIEAKYPDYDNIILTGGKDSQITALIPKKNDKKWHIFSAEPNYPLVAEWIEKNGLEVGQVFRHDNQNEETPEDTQRKIICSDLYSDLQHIRWLPTLREIAAQFSNKCIFWTGTAADSIYGYNEVFRDHVTKGYFDIHRTRVSPRQGNYHQTFKNFVGSPLISPYHSPEIWREVYIHYNPAIIKKGDDLRSSIAERLLGKPIIWPSQNPGPLPYAYPEYIDAFRCYLEFIESNYPTTFTV